MDERETSIDRRRLLMGAVSGASALAMLSGLATSDTATASEAAPEALGAVKRGEFYLGIDCLAFWPASGDRIYQDATGTQPLSPSNRMHAPLPLPVGSTISEISASYHGAPVVEINKRPLFSGTAATAPTPVFQKSLPISPGGPLASTLKVSPAVVLAPDATYLVSVFLTAAQSILGMRIGYRPPTQSFVPFTGGPHVYDTRQTGGQLQVGVARKVRLGLFGARSAVFNLTAVNPARAGFLSCYRAGGQANIRSVQFKAGQTTENLVICPLTPDGAITLRASGSPTHAFVELIGSLV